MTQDYSCVSSVLQERGAAIVSRTFKRTQNSVFLGVLKQRFPPELQQLPIVLLVATTTLLLLPRQLSNDATRLKQIFRLVWTPEASWAHQGEGRSSIWHKIVQKSHRKTFISTIFPHSHPKMLLPNPRVWAEQSSGMSGNPQGSSQRKKCPKREENKWVIHFSTQYLGHGILLLLGSNLPQLSWQIFSPGKAKTAISEQLHSRSPRNQFPISLHSPHSPEARKGRIPLSPPPEEVPISVFPAGFSPRISFCLDHWAGRSWRRSQSCPCCGFCLSQPAWGSDCWTWTEHFSLISDTREQRLLQGCSCVQVRLWNVHLGIWKLHFLLQFTQVLHEVTWLFPFPFTSLLLN